MTVLSKCSSVAVAAVDSDAEDWGTDEQKFVESLAATILPHAQNSGFLKYETI